MFLIRWCMQAARCRRDTFRETTPLSPSRLGDDGAPLSLPPPDDVTGYDVTELRRQLVLEFPASNGAVGGGVDGLSAWDDEGDPVDPPSFYAKRSSVSDDDDDELCQPVDARDGTASTPNTTDVHRDRIHSSPSLSPPTSSAFNVTRPITNGICPSELTAVHNADQLGTELQCFSVTVDNDDVQLDRSLSPTSSDIQPAFYYCDNTCARDNVPFSQAGRNQVDCFSASAIDCSVSPKCSQSSDVLHSSRCYLPTDEQDHVLASNAIVAVAQGLVNSAIKEAIRLLIATSNSEADGVSPEAFPSNSWFQTHQTAVQTFDNRDPMQVLARRLVDQTLADARAKLAKGMPASMVCAGAAAQSAADCVIPAASVDRCVSCYASETSVTDAAEPARARTVSVENSRTDDTGVRELLPSAVDDSLPADAHNVRCVVGKSRPKAASVCSSSAATIEAPEHLDSCGFIEADWSLAKLCSFRSSFPQQEQTRVGGPEYQRSTDFAFDAVDDLLNKNHAELLCDESIGSENAALVAAFCSDNDNFPTPKTHTNFAYAETIANNDERSHVAGASTSVAADSWLKGNSLTSVNRGETHDFSESRLRLEEEFFRRYVIPVDQLHEEDDGGGVRSMRDWPAFDDPNVTETFDSLPTSQPESVQRRNMQLDLSPDIGDSLRDAADAAEIEAVAAFCRAVFTPVDLTVGDDEISPPAPTTLDAVVSSPETPDSDSTGVHGGGRPTSVRRCISLRTSPGTPHRKKSVRFADALGLDLEYVKQIQNVDDLPSIDPRLPRRPPLVEASAAWHRLRPSSSRRYICACFQAPGSHPDFLDRVRQTRVALENCTADESALTIDGVVRVANLTFSKAVAARVTTDGWSTQTDVAAGYVPRSNDGSTDRFAFQIVLPRGATDAGRRIEFAVSYTATYDDRPGHSETYWDNNFGANYCFECYGGGGAESADPEDGGSSSSGLCESDEEDSQLFAWSHFG